MNSLQSLLATLPCGFLTEEQLPELVKLDRLHPVLVRCGGGRFTCGAQDVAHFLKCVTAGGDYVRDVSIPAGCEERAAQWSAEPLPQTLFRAANNRAEKLVGQEPKRQARKYVDAWTRAAQFDESQCGGVFDGNQVTSDADSGL